MKPHVILIDIFQLMNGTTTARIEWEAKIGECQKFEKIMMVK